MYYDEEHDFIDSWYQDIGGNEYDYNDHNPEEEERRVREMMQVDRDDDPEYLEDLVVDEELHQEWDDEDDFDLEPRELKPVGGWNQPMEPQPRGAFQRFRYRANAKDGSSLPKISAGKAPPGAPRDHICESCGKYFPIKLRLKFHWCNPEKGPLKLPPLKGASAHPGQRRDDGYAPTVDEEAGMQVFYPTTPQRGEKRLHEDVEPIHMSQGSFAGRAKDAKRAPTKQPSQAWQDPGKPVLQSFTSEDKSNKRHAFIMGDSLGPASVGEDSQSKPKAAEVEVWAVKNGRKRRPDPTSGGKYFFEEQVVDGRTLRIRVDKDGRRVRGLEGAEELKEWFFEEEVLGDGRCVKRRVDKDGRRVRGLCEGAESHFFYEEESVEGRKFRRRVDTAGRRIQGMEGREGEHEHFYEEEMLEGGKILRRRVDQNGRRIEGMDRRDVPSEFYYEEEVSNGRIVRRKIDKTGKVVSQSEVMEAPREMYFKEEIVNGRPVWRRTDAKGRLLDDVDGNNEYYYREEITGGVTIRSIVDSMGRRVKALDGSGVESSFFYDVESGQTIRKLVCKSEGGAAEEVRKVVSHDEFEFQETVVGGKVIRRKVLKGGSAANGNHSEGVEEEEMYFEQVSFDGTKVWKRVDKDGNRIKGQGTGSSKVEYEYEESFVNGKPVMRRVRMQGEQVRDHFYIDENDKYEYVPFTSTEGVTTWRRNVKDTGVADGAGFEYQETVVNGKRVMKRVLRENANSVLDHNRPLTPSAPKEDEFEFEETIVHGKMVRKRVRRLKFKEQQHDEFISEDDDAFPSHNARNRYAHRGRKLKTVGESGGAAGDEDGEDSDEHYSDEEFEDDYKDDFEDDFEEEDEDQAARKHWAELEYEAAVLEKQREAAATKIQATWRMCLERRVFERKRNAAIVIQAMVRRSLVFLRKKVEHLRVKVAATRIQSRVRMRQVKKDYAQHRAAAIIIQKAIRTWPFKKEFLRRRAVLTNLQLRAKARYARRSAAAMVIQGHMRERWYKRDLEITAIKMQARVRGAAARRPYLQAKRRKDQAAQTIQDAYHAMLRRRQFKDKEAAVVRIQTAWRRYVAYDAYVCLQLAAQIACKNARAALSTRRYLRMRKAAIKIQARARGNRDRAFAAKKRVELHVQTPAAIVIQRYARGFLVRERKRILAHKREYSALYIQKMWRGSKAREATADLFLERTRRKLAAALKIQRRYKRFIARMRLWRGVAQKKIAAICIQRHVRGLLARRMVERLWAAEMLKWATKAAVTIQKHARGSAVRRKYRGFRIERQRRIKTEKANLRAQLEQMLAAQKESDLHSMLKREIQALLGIQGEDMGRRAEAAEAIAKATFDKNDAEVRERVAQLQAISPLVQLISESQEDLEDGMHGSGLGGADSDKAAEQAALALCHLARSKNLRSDISQANGIPVLLSLLKVDERTGEGRPVAVVRNTLLCLVNLATIEANRVMLRKQGAVALLARHIYKKGAIIKPEGDSAPELAIRLLATLCNCKEKEAENVRDQALESGILPLMVELLGLGVGHPSTAFTLQALVKLLEGSVENKEVWKVAGGILALVRMLEKSASCGDTVIVGRTIMALLNASSNSRANKLDIVNEGGVDLVLWILQELVSDTESAALPDAALASDVVLLLRNLATESADSQAEVVEAGAVPLLMRLIRRSCAVASGDVVGVDPKVSEAHFRVMRSGLNALNSVLPLDMARVEARVNNAAIHLIQVLNTVHAKQDKPAVKFVLQSLAQLSADCEDDWLQVNESGAMTLMQRVLQKSPERPPPPKSQSGGWWKGITGNKARGKVEREEEIPLDMRRMRGDRLRARLIRAKEKGQKESTRWRVEQDAHKAKQEAEQEIMQKRKNEEKETEEEKLARSQYEAEMKKQEEESAKWAKFRVEAQKRYEAREDRYFKAQRRDLRREELERMQRVFQEKYGQEAEITSDPNATTTTPGANSDPASASSYSYTAPQHGEGWKETVASRTKGEDSVGMESSSDAREKRRAESTYSYVAPPKGEDSGWREDLGRRTSSTQPTTTNTQEPQAQAKEKRKSNFGQSQNEQWQAQWEEQQRKQAQWEAEQAELRKQYEAQQRQRAEREAEERRRRESQQEEYRRRASQQQEHEAQRASQTSEPSPGSTYSGQAQQQQQWSDQSGAASQGPPPPPPPPEEAEEGEHNFACNKCGHRFRHRIRLKLHWCAGMDPADRDRQREEEDGQLRQGLEDKKNKEKEKKQLWLNFLQAAEDEEDRRRSGNPSTASADDDMQDADIATLRDIIQDLVAEMVEGKDKVRMLQAFRVPINGSSASDLKLAYRKAAMRYHPDKNRNVGIRQRLFAEEVFKTISQRMEML